jgi:hypothetical protein
MVKIIQKSELPWKGEITITLELSKKQQFSLFLRIPDWSYDTDLNINGQKHSDVINNGKYIEILRNWSDNDEIVLTFNMIPTFVESDPRIRGNKKRVAISNGPLIYCFEQFDNENIDIFNSVITKDQDLRVLFETELLGGVNIITGTITNGNKFTAIPYFSWNNRGANNMQVWHLAI